MWQMGGFGPMLGQNHHFNKFAPERIPYAIDRYINETKAPYTVLNKQIDWSRSSWRESIQLPIWQSCLWALRYEWQGIHLEDYPYVQDYIERLTARSAIQKLYRSKSNILLCLSLPHELLVVVYICFAFGAATLLPLQSEAVLITLLIQGLSNPLYLILVCNHWKCLGFM